MKFERSKDGQPLDDVFHWEKNFFMPWAGFEPTSPWLPVGCDHHYTIRATMLATWPIWIANGNYVVIPRPCFSPTRWRCINQNDDSQADEREEDNLYTSYECLSREQRIPGPQEDHKWIHSPSLGEM